MVLHEHWDSRQSLREPPDRKRRMKSVHVHDVRRFTTDTADQFRGKPACVVHEMICDAVSRDGLVGMRGLDDDDVDSGTRHGGCDRR